MLNKMNMFSRWILELMAACGWILLASKMASYLVRSPQSQRPIYQQLARGRQFKLCTHKAHTQLTIFSFSLSLSYRLCQEVRESRSSAKQRALPLPVRCNFIKFQWNSFAFFQVPPVGLDRHHSKWIIFKLKHEDCDVGRGIKWQRGAPLVNCLLRVKSWNSAGRLSVPPLCTTILSYRGRLVPLSIHKEHTRLAFFLKSFLSKLN